MTASSLNAARELQQIVRGDLWGQTLPFWARSSVDAKHGGFFNCLDEDGSLTDSTKHVWLQGRQCWMWGKLANTYGEVEFAALAERHARPVPGRAPSRLPASLPSPAPVPLTRAAFVAAAERGVDFLRKYAVQRDVAGAVTHVLFALAEDGTPALNQRKMFSASFVCMGLAEVARATGRVELRAEAVELLECMLKWIRDPTGGLGKPGLPGLPALEPLNVPMILLNVIMELREGCAEGEKEAFYAAERAWAIEGVLKHASEEHGATFECVRPDGSFELSTMDGRLLCPGHAIEAGWFLLDAVAEGDVPLGVDAASVRARSLLMINRAFELGWDGAMPGGELGAPAKAAGGGSGGLIYFVDACGLSPSQLEWPMKLWWPQAEAMVAYAKAYATTLDPVHLAKLQLVADWVYAHLVDSKQGEWWGYSDRNGVVTHRFKGGAYKGCFHVPRALLLVDQALGRAIARLEVCA